MGLGDADQPGMGTEEIMSWLDETAVVFIACQKIILRGIVLPSMK